MIEYNGNNMGLRYARGGVNIVKHNDLLGCPGRTTGSIVIMKCATISPQDDSIS